MKLQFNQVQELAKALIEEAQQQKVSIAFAISDTSGELLGFNKMDGVSSMAANLAIAKAYTAAREGQATLDMGQWARENQRDVGYWADPNVTLFAGGVPIKVDGIVIGALGISGLAEEDDHKLAEQVIALTIFA
ncbi:heme-binding protein [Saccharobesus litoralis]|uniref:Heme-binding protein n=1 Tax=Saccharobesus litoralis TaxID=2172099 RepID=A0A2S0VWV6_9ALTE|nr:heme-binding protein [Saccharobesus litoralis]AWB68701.1 heme-binding protein [Saccharobesus litoralis]